MKKQRIDLYGFREVLFEYNPKGIYIGVCAIDPETLLEATIIGPRSANLESLKMLAIRKLRMVVDKKKSHNIKKSAQKPAKSYKLHNESHGKQEKTSGWDL